jgi:hypothetical protein
MQSSATHEFTMDPNLLVSVIKQQAGTLSKALLEGVMNSIDAGATRVDVTLTTESFVIEDNGRGFASEEEIQNWFGRFGTPHVENDAVYGRFRMGRGQMMAFAETKWKSGTFVMNVDIEKRGLTYDLALNQPLMKGCVIEGKLYEPLPDYKFRDTLTELKKSVAYTPKPVYVNNELYGAPAARLKTWTFEDEDAYYKMVQGANELQVYNQGVFVEEMSTWRVGMGGIVVSKTALQVNFARNSVMEDKCPVWKRVLKQLETQVLSKMVLAKTLSDSERKYFARRLSSARYQDNLRWREAKVLTDPSGKHMALSELKRFKNFVYIGENTTLACAAHGEQSTFVVTEATLNRFGVGNIQDWLEHLQRLSADLIDPEYTILDADKIAHMGFGGTSDLEAGGLARRERAAHATLSFLNDKLALHLMNSGLINQPREIRVGKHKANKFIAWTDGKSYITANRRFFKRFEQGLDGVMEWLLTLVHEYTHDTDDSESHEHGEVFYRKFHDTATTQLSLRMGSLVQAGLAEYLRQLNVHGVARPRKLRLQLRGDRTVPTVQ